MPASYPYTITNSQKGGFFMRTYNRNVRRAWEGDDYHAPKRQRLDEPKYASLSTTNENLHVEDNLQRAIRETSVAAMSSSPSRKNSTVFSYNEVHDHHHHNQLTPPSSPPPILDITPPVIKARKPTFSALEKKKLKEREILKNAKRRREEDGVVRDGSEPLSEILNSSRGSTQPMYSELQPVQPPRLASQQSKSMTQTILDFGQSNTPVTCGQCQMSYTLSLPEDVTLHDMFHNRHNKGIELGKPFMRSAMKWCYEVSHIPGSVVVVDRKISLPARRTVQKVLEVVNKELGSVEIPESDLWGQKMLEGEADDGKKVDNYKVFLHIIDGKCVAVCLAERISKAFKVKTANLPEPSESKDSEKEANREDSALLTPTSSTAPQFPSSADLILEEESVPATVGVSRIWTSKTFRKQGIANNLLDCVTTQFIYGMDIEKEEIAFSQPTDSGASLARGWHGLGTEWSVYRET